MSLKVLRDESFELSRDERGFYHLRIIAGEEINVDHIKKIESFISTEFNAECAPLLIELEYGSTFSEGVQEHLKDSPSRHSTADAILISTYAHEIVAQFYLKYFKPSKPTKVFSDKEKAIQWLGTLD